MIKSNYLLTPNTIPKSVWGCLCGGVIRSCTQSSYAIECLCQHTVTGCPSVCSARKHYKNNHFHNNPPVNVTLQVKTRLLPGLGSILARKSRWGRSRQRLLGSPSRCSTSTSSLIPWVNDCGLWCYSGVKQNKPSLVINHCGCQDSRLAKKTRCWLADRQWITYTLCQLMYEKGNFKPSHTKST